jgi:hypothetical protein
MRWCNVIWLPFAMLMLSEVTVSVQAQDLKIRTHLYYVGADASGELVSREQAVSLTIFHAGRVYDYVDSPREIIIFEPTQHRFTIVNVSRSLTTTVDFDEVSQMLKVAKLETEKYLEQVEKENGGELTASAIAVRSQLRPEFEEVWKPVSKKLDLHNPSVRYTAKCEPAEDPSVHESYLRYADWMARLNFVLHPQSLYPAGRLRLNEALRTRQLYPTEVKLFYDEDPRTHLKAEHRYSWTLDSIDRRMIHEWESELTSGKLRTVSFREYQEAMVLSKR